ncbi:lipoate--protein ligase [Lacticaseibacillus yichunensis]|uniref:lipoate--protein ligase n=1 Tax=Lacticaseibacillus yichunensis TaxID=2486015 RepID=A0ABW4CQ38_9LACO|nr:lipoate--protein ligase [Lacticaseibacillus yichunensis]
MYYVVMKSHDIRMNLATEQYLMNNRSFDAPLLLFYYEGPSVIVGRNQNTAEELNQDYIDAHDIVVTRRLSGGGAVYHDLGNLCFSFVVDANASDFGDFKSFTQPIVDALHSMGATTAEVSGRNDILVDGKKFSGNAMYTRNGKTFSHGTLMLDVDMSVVPKVLNVPADKIASKGIQSVRSRVTNLRPYLDPQYQDLTVPEFRDILLKRLFDVDSLDAIKDREVQITPEDQAAVDQIYNEVYSNWDWVYGQSPAYTQQKRQHFDMGTIDARLTTNEGKITDLHFFGDFFGAKNADELAQALIGTVYDTAHLTEALKDVDTNAFFTGVPKEDLIALLTRT